MGIPADLTPDPLLVPTLAPLAGEFHLYTTDSMSA
jgi:hypothetical protein